jgi:hypothetical protein
MLKHTEKMKNMEKRAAEQVQDLLRKVPSLRLEDIEYEPRLAKNSRSDFLIKLKAGNRSYQLIGEFKPVGQPRVAREAVAQLRHYCDLAGDNAYGIFVAPYLSESSREICAEFGVGFADLEGKRLHLIRQYLIDRTVDTKPQVERREIKSLFTPKSAQVLRVLMRDPSRRWKVTDLAEEADVSIGHVSNVRNALLDREWAQADSAGIHVSDPDGLLDTWRDAYRRPPGKRQAFYTLMHGGSIQDAIQNMWHGQQQHDRPHAMLCSYSAAQWLAPYARISTEYFYADKAGLEYLKSWLELRSIAKGENVVVWLIEDPGFFSRRHITRAGYPVHRPCSDLPGPLRCG